MQVGMLLEMAADGMADRVAFGSRHGNGRTFGQLGERARRVAAFLAGTPGERVVLVDVNSEAVPLCLFGAAMAGKAFTPVNYRLSDEQLRAIVSRAAPAIVIAGDGVAERLGSVEGLEIMSRAALLERASDETAEQGDGWGGDPEAVVVMLFTSGTTGEPKAAVLRNRHLASYVVSTVEFAGADEDECAIVSVPPYHIAGVSAVLSSAYAGRRVVQLEAFQPDAWVDLARTEEVTHAMVVPTMLNRILDVVEADGRGLPTLRSLSYGGGPMPVAVIERAMRALPGVGFVNAYGLTETSSTIAVLGPEDHRVALLSEDPAVRARLGSVGRPLPSLEVAIHDADGTAVPHGTEGEIRVRGEQVAGEYLGRDDRADGWFATRDRGHFDAEGYLFVHGRLDDVIVRGGENLSPGEIESVLADHPAVTDAAVVGVPDTEWGEKVVAVVVLAAGASATEEELRDHVRARLRSARTPERIEIREDLPYTETGKLLRRVLRAELS